MRRLKVFNMVSMDGFIADKGGDMSWAHKDDPEWNDFVKDNAGGGGELVMGRVTYDMMIQYWPTPAAKQNDPVVADRMNNLPKVVFSRTLKDPTWNNTRVLQGDLPAAVRKLKSEDGQDMVIFGSGSIVSQLAPERLIDEYQLIFNPIVVGKGKSMFSDISQSLPFKRTGSRTFSNGNVMVCYEPG